MSTGTIPARGEYEWVAKNKMVGLHTITASDDGIGIVIVTTTIGTRTHGDDPSWFWHLVVNFSQGGSHFVGEGSGNDHDVTLTGTSTEDDTETILVVSGCSHVHHLDGAASETESHGPY